MLDLEAVFCLPSDPAKINSPKSILSVFSLLILLFSLACFSCDNGTMGSAPVDPFIGGTGTPNTDWYTANPSAASFTISSADDLAGLAQLVNDGTDDFSGKTITLAANLDLTVYSGGQGWIPIAEFQGTLDGNNKSISNLYINTDDDYIGLFGYVYGTIRNLNLKDVDITGGYFVGSIVGWAENSTIENCSVSGSVKGFKETGGLVGWLYNSSTMNGCFSEAAVSSSLGSGTAEYTGGLVGYVLDESTVINCGAAGTVTGKVSVGGAFGVVENSSEVSNCYACGKVEGIENVGGLTGYLSRYTTITNCYATGMVNGDDSVGGIVGSVTIDSLITKCYASGAISGKVAVGGLAGYFEGSSMTLCLALNAGLTRTSGSASSFGRVAGYFSSGTVSPNYALVFSLPSGVMMGIGGIPITNPANIRNQAFYENSFWSFGNDDDHPWKMGNAAAYTLPVLYWQKPASYPVLP